MTQTSNSKCKIATVGIFESFKYKEVFEITKFKDGLIYKTESTGSYIYYEDISKLDNTKYTYADLSDKLLNGTLLLLPLFKL